MGLINLKFSDLGQAVMHPMNLGLGLALLLHVAAGMSPAHKAQLDAFRAQLEAAGAHVNPKFSGLLPVQPTLTMPGQLPGAAAAGKLKQKKSEPIVSSTTDDGLSDLTTTASVDPSSTTYAVIQPEPQTDSKLGQLVKAVFEKLLSGKGISMIVDFKNLEEFIQS